MANRLRPPTSSPLQTQIKNNDAIEFEFNYYCILIRDLQPFMPEEKKERDRIGQWIHFLVNPLNEAQQLEFREKRNLYLFMICTALLSGNVIEFMNLSRKKHLMTDRKKVSKFTKVRGLKGPGAPSAPPIANEQGFPLTLKDALNPITLASFEDVLFRAEWQNGRFWEQRLENEKSAEKALMKSSKVRIQAKQDSNKCSIHGPDSECPKDLINSKIGDCLDKQFEYLLAMAESYKELLRRDDGGGEKVNRVNLWLQALSRVNTTACAHMKGIRNDYIMVLVGYLVNGELKGPFEDHPTENLQPLTQAIATYIAKRALKDDDDKKVPLNPASDTIENFMNECPIVEEGAFALLALSGNLFNFRRFYALGYLPKIIFDDQRRALICGLSVIAESTK